MSTTPPVPSNGMAVLPDLKQENVKSIHPIQKSRRTKKLPHDHEARNREPPRRPPSNLSEQEIEERKARRLGSKQKVALLLGFCGTGYQGMQINIDAKTIEGELFKALVKAKCVSEDNATDLKKIGFQRACRTDKGVHAIGNLVSCKLVIQHLLDPVQAINTYLPPEIRVWDIVRVNGSFDAKHQTDHRSYEYLLPTYILSPETDWDSVVECAKPVEDTYVMPEDISAPSNRSSYRITDDVLNRLRSILQMFVGTHNHHCFTIKKSPSDQSAMRYITQFTVSDPFVSNGASPSEWVSLVVQGQSFLMHQIRKMVGFAILVLKTNTPATPLLSDILSGQSVKVNIPKAPSLGLLLQHPVYNVYNERIKFQGVEDRHPIVFDQGGDPVYTFKHTMIYQKIIDQESETYDFHVWFEMVKSHPYTFRYFNRAGLIPSDYSCFDDEQKEGEITL